VRDPQLDTIGRYVTLQRGTTYKGTLVGKPGPALLGLGSIQPGGGFREDHYKTYGGDCPSKMMLYPGDLYVSLKGATKDGEMIGSVARVPPSVESGRLTQDTVKLEFLSPDPELARYIYWVLRTPQYRAYCAGHATGSAVVALSRHDFLSYPVPPHTSVRRSLVELLEAIEAKIEQNRRTNQTLEEMARAIFKSWFVDFDPVRAKAEGCKPAGTNEATAALFPEWFEESELGDIPRGWRATTLGEEAQRCGGTIQTGPFGSQLHASDYVPEGIPVVMPKNISTRRVSTVDIARIREQDAERLSRHRLKRGDVVYSRRGDVERHALISDRESGWLCGTGCLLVRLGPGWFSPLFLSLALDRPETRAWIVQHAIGATMPNLNTGILAAVPIVVPPNEIIKAFAEAADPLQILTVSTDAESGTLTSLRDTLLPRLLSGELTTQRAETDTEATACLSTI